MTEHTSNRLSNCLEQILTSHVLPSKEISDIHNAEIKILIMTLKKELPKEDLLFKNCSVELVGSVGCNTKVVESDEFDLNVVLDLPFESHELGINFEDSSPTRASIEINEISIF